MLWNKIKSMTCNLEFYLMGNSIVAYWKNSISKKCGCSIRLYAVSKYSSFICTELQGDDRVNLVIKCIGGIMNEIKDVSHTPVW